MKQLFRKIMAFAMAIVVLFTTMSFHVAMHYCGDTLVETAIFEKLEGCGMEMDLPSPEGCAIIKKNCCSDESIVAEGQSELQQSVHKISFEQQVFITSYVYSYIQLFEGLGKKGPSYEKYEPPLVIRQIFKLDETYLI